MSADIDFWPADNDTDEARAEQRREEHETL